ncbi:MAG TPA: hypothetical protein VKB25_05775 [Conexibacter sp.]|nr:hypothetical protein [Conexibacter sp.]
MTDPAHATLTAEEREDARQVIALAIAASQRERAAADQTYIRGRNFIAFVASLFVAAQAAFVATIGRESGGEALLDAKDLALIRWPAGTAAVLLVAAFAVMMMKLDRSKDMTLLGSRTLSHIWSGDDNGGVSRLDALVVASLAEEEEWATANAARRKALGCVSIVGGLAAVAVFVQLVCLYIGLT